MVLDKIFITFSYLTLNISTELLSSDCLRSKNNVRFRNFTFSSFFFAKHSISFYCDRCIDISN